MVGFTFQYFYLSVVLSSFIRLNFSNLLMTFVSDLAPSNHHTSKVFSSCVNEGA
jgi:hypothetical protein